MDWIDAFLLILGLSAIAGGSYAVGRQDGLRKAAYWRRKYKTEHGERVLLRKQCDGLIQEIDEFLPKGVWRNERWHPSDQRYGVYPYARPTGHRE